MVEVAVEKVVAEETMAEASVGKFQEMPASQVVLTTTRSNTNAAFHHQWCFTTVNGASR